MIQVVRSPDADSRTMSKEADKEAVRKSTELHIKDVQNGIGLIVEKLHAQSALHDHTKIERMDEFYNALRSDSIKDTPWYKDHVTLERHHIKKYVHNDLTLVDVIECIVDCTMAAIARQGSAEKVYDIDLPYEVLQLAIQNTSKMIADNVQLVEPDKDLLDMNL